MSDYQPDPVESFISFILLPLLMGLGCCGLVVVGVLKIREAAGWGGVALVFLLLIGVGYLLIKGRR